jgi:alkanesulfonate monooxygenase SsuD/methylene tetrahydromethanopterin reductase-like flavin-dependent oxidoreductase (luciferase family)
MRLGISMILGGAESPGDLVARRARAAEANGLDSVWFFDSIGRTWPSIDPLMCVSVAAAVTERIEVGTGILQIPLRHPVELANRVLTAQLFCGGRLTLGVGAGSTRDDFEAVDQPYEDRMRLFNDGLATMRRLWDGEIVGTANLRPVDEVRGGPPVIIGSWAGPKWIPRAAEEFDGWIASAHFSGYDTLKNGIEAYRAAGGKRALVTNIGLDLTANTEPLDDANAPYSLHCDLQTAKERLQRLADLGYDDAVVVHHGEGEPDFAAIRALLPV